MDIMLHQANSSGYFESEDETFFTVNEVLQKLIIDVEGLLITTECENNFNSEQSDLGVKIDQTECDNLEIENSECKSGLSFEQSNLEANERKPIYEDSKLDFPISTECNADSNSEQSDLGVKIDQTECDNSEIENSECKSGLSFEQSNLDANERKPIYEESKLDFPISTECNADSNSEQHDLGVCGGQISQEVRQNDDSSDEDFEDSLSQIISDDENPECNPTVGPLRSANNLFDRRTESSSEDGWISVDSSDSDDVELFEQVGDQEVEGDLDDASFLQRVIQYVRETDMLLMANRGGGDVLLDTDDDFDNDSDDD